MTTHDKGTGLPDDFSDAFDRGADALADAVTEAVLGRIDAALADPIVQAVLAADRLSAHNFRTVLREAAARLLSHAAEAGH